MCRFDRQITLDRPDIAGREQIFRIHLDKLKLEHPIEYFSERMAALTPGFAGADIANVSNEAALIAGRSGKDAITLSDFEAAVDRVIGGLEKKNKVRECFPWSSTRWRDMLRSCGSRCIILERPESCYCL